MTTVSSTNSFIKVIIIAVVVFCQFLLVSADAFSFQGPADKLSGTTAHHETLTTDQDKQTPVVTDKAELNCDHCCSCHGHFNHLIILSDSAFSFADLGAARPSNYIQPLFSKFQTRIERPPKNQFC